MFLSIVPEQYQKERKLTYLLTYWRNNVAKYIISRVTALDISK